MAREQTQAAASQSWEETKLQRQRDVSQALAVHRQEVQAAVDAQELERRAQEEADLHAARDKRARLGEDAVAASVRDKESELQAETKQQAGQQSQPEPQSRNPRP